ncbi:MAG: helix-hairpin-helix domain-containing protein [Chloroflexi bacterium]|nr:helix-hairpin-helix domain-containing protein [Chloroflexota bacterium]
MAMPQPAIEGGDAHAAALRGLRLLTIAAALATLVFSILLAGTGPADRLAWAPGSIAESMSSPQASGDIAINTLPAEDLAALLPGIGPVYAARIVHARTLFGPLRSAADLRALGIPDNTVERVLPLISFRAPDRPGIASPA